jgi:hypothetical protein
MNAERFRSDVFPESGGDTAKAGETKMVSVIGPHLIRFSFFVFYQFS